MPDAGEESLTSSELLGQPGESQAMQMRRSTLADAQRHYSLAPVLLGTLLAVGLLLGLVGLLLAHQLGGLTVEHSGFKLGSILELMFFTIAMGMIAAVAILLTVWLRWRFRVCCPVCHVALTGSRHIEKILASRLCQDCQSTILLDDVLDPHWKHGRTPKYIWPLFVVLSLAPVAIYIREDAAGREESRNWAIRCGMVFVVSEIVGQVRKRWPKTADAKSPHTNHSLDRGPT